MPLRGVLSNLPAKPVAATRVESAMRAVESLPLSPLERMQLGLRIFDAALGESSVRACLEFIRMHHPTPSDAIDIEDGVHQMRDEQGEQDELTENKDSHAA